MSDYRIGDEVYIHGIIDEIRKDTIIIKNEGGYFGTVADEIMPSAQPERKNGKWVKEYWNGEHTRKCSSCNITQTVTTYRGKVNFNYCPYCGADMRGEQDDESRSKSNAQTDTRARGMGTTDKSSGI